MFIPSVRENLIRNYENALFYRPTEPKSDRQYVFYLLLRPILEWVKRAMISKFNLEPDEAESELYLLCARLFDGFDKEKGSIIPYLRSHISWKTHHLLRGLAKTSQREVVSGLINLPEEPYCPQEEYYWSVPDILFAEKFIKKLFTRDQKYYIYNILMSDDNKLTVKDLAAKCGVSRPTMALRLSELKRTLDNWRR